MNLIMFLIPGLGMNANELSKLQNFNILQNPGFEKCVDELAITQYSLDDVALMHIESINKLASNSSDVVIGGFSLGGMVLSIMATKYRHLLPSKIKFLFIATSPNLKSNPVITPKMLKEWSQVKSGDVEAFAKIMSPFFSKNFIENNRESLLEYARYRAYGKNGQSAAAFKNQLLALLQFDGTEAFSKVDNDEAYFYFFENDQIINVSQKNDLLKLNPSANITVLKNVGHMIHLENNNLLNEIFTW